MLHIYIFSRKNNLSSQDQSHIKTNIVEPGCEKNTSANLAGLLASALQNVLFIPMRLVLCPVKNGGTSTNSLPVQSPIICWFTISLGMAG